MQSKKKLFALIGFVPIFMFGFAFAMVPLYGWYCDVAGINNVQSAEREPIPSIKNIEVGHERNIKIEFDATLHESVEGIVSEFRSLTPSITLSPGDVHSLVYRVKNISANPLVTQAVPSITPWWGGEHFKKIECFCFEQQTLAPGEEKEMGLQFYVHPDIPENIKTLTLSYTLMAASEMTKSASL